MNFALNKYKKLFDEFLSQKLSAEMFQALFLNAFKSEKIKFSDNVYGMLEEVFGCVDSYTTDKELLNSNPDFYVDEQRLRKVVQQAIFVMALEE